MNDMNDPDQAQVPWPAQRAISGWKWMNDDGWYDLSQSPPCMPISFEILLIDYIFLIKGNLKYKRFNYLIKFNMKII